MTIGRLIQLSERDKSTNKSAPQILDLPQIDSKIYQSYQETDLNYAKIRTLREDPTVQLARMAVVAPIVHTPWIYNAEKDCPTEAIEATRTNFENIRLWFLQTAVYGCLDFGWQPFEIIYKPEDGYIWIDNLKPLLQDYTTILVYINNGKFAGYTNEPTKVGLYQDDTTILDEYALHTCFSVEGTDWYGHSVFDSLYDTLENYADVNNTANRYDKKIAGATWVVYYPVGKTYYKGTDTDNDEIALTILSKLQASGAVAIPDEIQEFLDDSVDKEMKGKWRVELITANSSTASSFNDRLKYLDALKMRAFGIPERSVLEGTHGTKAEAGEHTNIALGTIGVKHLLLCNMLNNFAVRPFLRFNFGKKYQDCIKITPAPIVSAHYETLKEIYRLIIQSPETLLKEYANINVEEIRSALDIPSIGVVKNG